MAANIFHFQKSMKNVPFLIIFYKIWKSLFFFENRMNVYNLVLYTHRMMLNAYLHEIQRTF